MYEYTIPARAIIAYTSEEWRLENVLCREPGKGELLVQLVASGICHTDVANVGGIAPRILGHEGAGKVLKKGPELTIDVSSGDPVLLSFAHCQDCYFCSRGHPAHCVNQVPLTIQGCDPNFALADREDERLAVDEQGKHRIVAAGYFGHSSFSSIALVKESSVLNVKNLIKSDDELRMFAPLGCGFQTGTCTVTNVADLGEHDSLGVFGLGGVGLSAVMVSESGNDSRWSLTLFKAGKARNLAAIIAVDIVQSRIDMARSLGATHCINSKGMTKEQLTAAIRALPPFSQSEPGSQNPLGPSAILDTTGLPNLLQAALASVNRLGRVIQLANQGLGSTVSVDLAEHMRDGVHLSGTIQGDANPKKSIPMLIQWFREGKFPVDKLEVFYPVEKFAEARQGMHSGEVIKPILLWDSAST